MKWIKWRSIVVGILAVAATGYVLADTFWIPKAGTKPIAKTKIVKKDKVVKNYADLFAMAADSKGEVVATPTEYRDNHVTITTSVVRVNDTNVHLADITVDNPYFWRSAFAQGTFGRNITAKTSEMAAQNEAILAINGDFYGFRDTGYVIRNGVLYRDTPAADANTDALVIDAKGDMFSANQSQVTAQQLLALGAQQVLSFGPTLIQSGEIKIDTNFEVKEADVTNPRTAIGQIGDKHYLIAVSDGRTKENIGLNLYSLAQVMQQAGAKYAYNLDGGGSSAMVLNNNVVNVPIAGLTGTNTAGTQRAVSDILYIGYK
jgi:exopolysaccharide biosynthesis protein